MNEMSAMGGKREFAAIVSPPRRLHAYDCSKSESVRSDLGLSGLRLNCIWRFFDVAGLHHQRDCAQICREYFDRLRGRYLGCSSLDSPETRLRRVCGWKADIAASVAWNAKWITASVSQWGLWAKPASNVRAVFSSARVLSPCSVIFTNSAK